MADDLILSSAVDLFRALDRGPRLLAGGQVKSLEVEITPLRLSTVDPKQESLLVLSDGTRIPFEGMSTWQLKNGKRYSVLVFSWNGHLLAGVIDKTDWQSNPRFPWVDVWGPFPTVEAAHGVVNLINAH